MTKSQRSYSITSILCWSNQSPAYPYPREGDRDPTSNGCQRTYSCVLKATLWKSLAVPQFKLTIEFPYDPSIPFLGVYREQLKTGVETKTGTCMHNKTIPSSQKWKPPKCPSTGEWINTLWSIPYKEILSHRKEGSSDTHYNMDETWKHYARHKRAHYMIWFMWNIQTRQIQRDKKQIDGRQVLREGELGNECPVGSFM